MQTLQFLFCIFTISAVQRLLNAAKWGRQKRDVGCFLGWAQRVTDNFRFKQ